MVPSFEPLPVCLSSDIVSDTESALFFLVSGLITPLYSRERFAHPRVAVCMPPVGID